MACSYAEMSELLAQVHDCGHKWKPLVDGCTCVFLITQSANRYTIGDMAVFGVRVG